jgi:peptide-methionine (S)-S-oxide reductase
MRFYAILLPSLLLAIAAPANAETRTAIFAGGCFWCIEADFEKLDGVEKVVSGYTGGLSENPTYKQVTYEDTGHYEAVEVTYDAHVVSYRNIVSYFFRHVDPTDADGQFCDRGPSYRTAIWTNDADERTIALDEKAKAEAELGKTVVTPILDRQTFWPAEDYHQDYYKKNSIKYGFYRRGCGRDKRVKALWGDK